MKLTKVEQKIKDCIQIQSKEFLEDLLKYSKEEKKELPKKQNSSTKQKKKPKK